MKKSLILLSFVVFYSCSDNRNKSVSESSIDRIEDILFEKKNQLLDKIEIAYAVNPAKYFEVHEEIGELIKLSDAINAVLIEENYSADNFTILIRQLVDIITNSESYDEVLRPHMSEWLNNCMENPPQREQIPFFQIEMDIQMNDLYGRLYSNASIKDFRVNKLYTVIIEEKNIVSVGETYTAKIGLLAYDSTSVPSVILDNGYYLEFIDGYNIFRSTSSTPGMRTFSGIMQLNYAGYIIEQHFEHSYEVK